MKFNHAPEDILDALMIIHQTCLDQECCAVCPFSNDKEECLISLARPDYWDISSNIPTKWQALHVPDFSKE